MTTETKRDFYITAFSTAYICDAACDSTAMALTFYQEGELKRMNSFLRAGAGTAERYNEMITFPFPIKVDRNTVIQIAGTKTAGTHTHRGTVFGFYL